MPCCTSSQTMNGTVAATSNSSFDRRAVSRAKPSSRYSSNMAWLSGQSSIASQPSHSSAHSATFFGPSAPR